MESLLNITTTPEFPTICIDGKEYQLNMAMDYTEMLHWERILTANATILKKENRNNEDEKTVQNNLRENIRRIIIVPENDDILEKLSDMQRSQILQIFATELKNFLTPPVQNGKTSPDSEDSTVVL